MFDLTLPQGAAVTFLILTLPFCIWVALADIRSCSKKPSVAPN